MSEENVRTNVLLAIPNIPFAESLKKHLKRKGFRVGDIVIAIEHLLETLENLDNEGTKVDAIILTSDIGKKLDDLRLELVADVLIKIREKFSHINVILLSNERRGHPFLAEVVQMGIYNIFLKGTDDISVEVFEEVIISPRTFAHASIYLNASPEIRWRNKRTSIQTIPDQPIVNQQVVEKKIVKNQVIKQVNKQVVKRNYQINVQSNIEKVVGIPIDKKLIMVGSPFSRSGSTFFSHLLARGLSKLGVGVTYIESPYSTSYTYDRFIGHERTPNYRSKFYQYTKEIDSKKPSEHDWELEGVSLVSKHPSDEPIYNEAEVSFDVFVKILLASTSTVTIVDVGTDWQKEVYKDIFDIAAKTYLIIEPDISNIQLFEDPDNETTKIYREIIDNEKNGLIGNRFDKSILKNDVILDLYEDKFKTVIPAFPSADVFRCQYEGTFINDMKIHSKQIEEALYPIIKELLPPQLLKKYRKQNSVFSGLFNKKFSVERQEE